MIPVFPLSLQHPARSWTSGHICPRYVYCNGHADSPEQSRETGITNDQIPMTNEKDNDQLTNDQSTLTARKKRPTSSGMEDLPVLIPCSIRRVFREMDYFGQQWMSGHGRMWYNDSAFG